MTIFEEYLNSKKEENRLGRNYIWNFHDYNANMCDVTLAKINLKELNNSLSQYALAQEKRQDIEKRIVELSYFDDSDARYILPKLMKDMTFEDYQFSSLVIDGTRRVFLIKKGSFLKENIIIDDLLTNENVIMLASTTDSRGFNLYHVISNTDGLGSELNANLYNSDFKFLKDFIDGYISIKAEREEISLEDYYLLVSSNIKHGYDEELINYYDLGNAYEDYDRKEKRRAKRRTDDYYHKKQRESINQAQAKRKIAKIPNKYLPKEDVGELTFIRRLELILGRKFLSIEKDTIKSWLILGFDEDIILKAYMEASIRGNYNNSAIAKILNDLITFDIKENNVKNMMLAKEMKKQ